MVLVDLDLCLAVGGRGRKRFGDGFAIRIPDEPPLGIVARIVRFGAMTSRFSATAGNGADLPRAKITEGIEMEQDQGAYGFQGG